ncbi:MAG TPA: twin-arginine translocase TatA/TatE family subunit [Synechococcales bacterium UBA10510]|nr:twin-arginine translocase TatA/TatE family subunit [Synechococcales bacterium UBA10510]
MNFFGIGLPELAVIAAIGLLVFGPKRLPELGKTLGRTLKGFQSASSEFEREFRASLVTPDLDPEDERYLAQAAAPVVQPAPLAQPTAIAQPTSVDQATSVAQVPAPVADPQLVQSPAVASADLSGSADPAVALPAVAVSPLA